MATKEADIPQTAVECLLSRRKLPVPRGIAAAVAFVAILISVFHLYTGWFGPLAFYGHEMASLHLILIMTILLNPLGRPSWQAPLNKGFIIDFILIALLIVFGSRTFKDFQDIVLYRSAEADAIDSIAGTVTILIVLELTRRCIGWVMVVVVGLGIAQALVSDKLPPPFTAPPIMWRHMVEMIYLQEMGLVNIPIKIVSEYIVLFFVMVAFWMESGAMRSLVELATALAGRYTGGPAKVAVVASGLLGTIQGVSITNVVATGSWTIPMMKGLGYRPHFAGAVEAVASTGGQIVPPVMGLAAFLMAEFLKVPYARVMLAGVIPSLFYYTATFMAIHFEAKKTGLGGLPPEAIPRLRGAAAKAWVLLVPIAVLVYFISQGYGIATAVMWAIIAFFPLTFLRRETRLSPTRFLRALEEGGKMVTIVGVACAAAGILIGAFWASGLTNKLASLVVIWAGGNLFVGLVMVAVAGLILGMGMPTTAVYIVMYLFSIPALIDLGASPLTAHFFAFFFACLSSITPPVALAAYVGAGIAGAPVMRTAVTAARIGFPLYFIPFFFVYEPAILFEGPLVLSLRILITGLIGVTAIAAGLTGWFMRPANVLERVLFLLAGLGLLYPEVYTDIVGLALLALLFWYQKKFAYYEPLRLVLGLFSRGKVPVGGKKD